MIESKFPFSKIKPKNNNNFTPLQLSSSVITILSSFYKKQNHINSPINQSISVKFCTSMISSGKRRRTLPITTFANANSRKCVLLLFISLRVATSTPVFCSEIRTYIARTIIQSLQIENREKINDESNIDVARRSGRCAQRQTAL